MRIEWWVDKVKCLFLKGSVEGEVLNCEDVGYVTMQPVVGDRITETLDRRVSVV